jgi:hypothetical protein
VFFEVASKTFGDFSCFFLRRLLNGVFSTYVIKRRTTGLLVNGELEMISKEAAVA